MDPAKRERTLEKRDLDFADAEEVFAGATFDRIDDRQDYGEERIIPIGRLAARMVVVVWTQRDDARHVISMRRANDREQDRYEAYLD
ncbi:BrnT family toxin [Aurantimonas sp. VKM B-3413]|uniref:BrnT family toxin n=1 Tax=Aurantimonas sp. VKM B-3413 TaxID=2779401 RepID=UPI00351D1AA6